MSTQLSNPALANGVRQAPPAAANIATGPTGGEQPLMRPFEKPIWRHGYVHLGMVVLWWPNGNARAEARPAIVVGIGASAIDVHVIEPQSDRFTRRDACHHMTATHISAAVREDVGGWDHTPTTKLLFRFDPEYEKFPEQGHWERWIPLYEEAIKNKQPVPPYPEFKS